MFLRKSGKYIIVLTADVTKVNGCVKMDYSTTTYCHICGSSYDANVFESCPYCEHDAYIRHLEEEINPEPKGR